MDKLVNDRDRQSRQDKKQIEYLEQDSRRFKTENKELQAKLNDMEGIKMNVEKEKEQLLVDLKSIQKRLENEKNRGDQTQVNLNQKELELQRCKDILSAANKQIKHLDAKLASVKAKKAKLKACLQDFTNVKGGKKAGQLGSSADVKMTPTPALKSALPEVKQAAPSIKVRQASQLRREELAELGLDGDDEEVKEKFSDDEDLDEVAQDGEILDDEDNPEVIRQNEFEKRAKEVLAATTGRSELKAILNDTIKGVATN